MSDKRKQELEDTPGGFDNQRKKFAPGKDNCPRDITTVN